MVAAGAHRAVLLEADVPDVAGAPVGAAVEVPVDDDAAADAGADLDEQEVRGRAGDAGVLLAQRHHVDVVVEQHRAAELARQGVADRVAVPPRHDRRRHRTPAWKSTGPGTPMPTPAGRSTPCSASSLRVTLDAPRRAPARDRGGCRPRGRAGEHAEPAVGDGDPHRRGAELDADEAEPGVEVDQRRAASAPRGRRAAVLGEAELDEPADLGGDRRPRDVQPAGQVHPRQRALVADVGQDPGLGGRLGPARQHVRHARILPCNSTDFRRSSAEWSLTTMRAGRSLTSGAPVSVTESAIALGCHRSLAKLLPLGVGSPFSRDPTLRLDPVPPSAGGPGVVVHRSRRRDQRRANCRSPQSRVRAARPACLRGQPGSQRALDRGGVRRDRAELARRLRLGAALRPAGQRSDHHLGAHRGVRVPLRALDGLRGVHPVADA